MARKLLFLASPTVDYIGGGGPRPGGPGLYGGLAARLLGYDPYVVGPLGFEDLWVIGEYRRYGIEYLGPRRPGCGYRFRHFYTEQGRVSEILCMPHPLALDEALEALMTKTYEVIVVSPVGCEVPPWILPVLASTGIPVTLDIQGFTRCYGDLWEQVLTRLQGVLIVHVSSDDLPQPPRLGGSVIAYTKGLEGGLVVAGEDWISELPRPSRLVEDPTGAGDVYTVIAAIRLAGHGDPVRAAVEAGDIAPGVLAKVKELIGQQR